MNIPALQIPRDIYRLLVILRKLVDCVSLTNDWTLYTGNLAFAGELYKLELHPWINYNTKMFKICKNILDNSIKPSGDKNIFNSIAFVCIETHTFPLFIMLCHLNWNKKLIWWERMFSASSDFIHPQFKLLWKQSCCQLLEYNKAFG